MGWYMSGNCGKSTSVADAMKYLVILGLRYPGALMMADNSRLSQMLIDGSWCVKRSFSRSGCFYRCISESGQDSDDPTNLALHPDQQFRNPATRVYGAQ